MTTLPPAERMPHILKHYRNIAVVGLSPQPHRASFDAVSYTHLTLPTNREV